MLAPALLALALARLATAYPDAADLAPTTANSTLPAVCTADLCLQGDNSLAAGVVVSGMVNGSTQRVTLLPGSYTSTSLAASNASSSVLSVLDNKAVVNATEGFASSGSLASSLAVSLEAGLTAYTSPLYQGAPSHLAFPSSALASNSTSYPSSAESLLLTSNTWAVVQLANDRSSRLVVWDSVPDVGQLDGGTGSGGVRVVDVQARGCATPCASGGTCTGNGTCACLDGFAGPTCGDCEAGLFGKACDAACPAGCANCDDGITGTGLCLDPPISNVTLPSACNCANGICATNSTSATCECSAGWTRASNGTQCAACATGYYLSSAGDCVACDPSCASCSSPSGTCLTCQAGLQPLASDGTKCTTATSASTNGTFVTCASRTFWDSTSASCVDCNPLCESCFKAGTDGCLSCRSPNVLLPGGACVAVDSKTGVCDGTAGANGTSVASGWVYDNTKRVCDALPAKCAAGGIDNFNSAASRSSLKCSRCLPGSYLVDGACVDECPAGTLVSGEGLSCAACDSSCATCSLSTSHCTSCASTSALILNGTCISGSSCPAGYFAPASNTSTCLACHPDCATCSSSLTTCLTCPPSRPVLTPSGSCVATCASSEYFDTAKSSCVACSSTCATCSGSGSGACMSCPAGERLKAGSCSKPRDACAVIAGFGVCLEDLVTVAAESAASETPAARWKMPWWLILVIVLVLVAVVGVGVWFFRRSEQKRRRAHTARFAEDLGDKEVDKKLAALPLSVAYPPIPRASSPTPSHVIPIPPLSPSGRDASHDIPLTPRAVPAASHHFVLEDPSSPVSSYAPSSPRAPPARPARPDDSRWSLSSYGSRIAPARRVEPQQTGASEYSQRTFVTQAGNTLTIQSRNPFLGRM